MRYMDDIVIFTRTRWYLRCAARGLNVFFASGGYRQHLDKTFVGKTEKGFDWMGIQFNRSGVEGAAPRAMSNHRQRFRRLYEPAWRYGKEKTRRQVGEYVRRWKIWRRSMLSTRTQRTEAEREIEGLNTIAGVSDPEPRTDDTHTNPPYNPKLDRCEWMGGRDGNGGRR